ncbi:sialidase family protein [Pseudodesulfovibrio tunisiensis]|uniref:sialidase family protein n=1 Tax=Pseudodesulfovibrio tunisiensis TaxID=463192 RepID=UPI001FB36F0F|nr:sialidase family protein [Pseudodesulfovibrio tunisiensis]
MPSISDNTERHEIVDRRPGQYLCFPDIVRAADGRLIVAYNEFDKHVGARRRLILKTSRNNGHAWSAPRYLDVTNSHCPRFTLLRDGQLMLIDDNRPTIHRSADNGEHWASHPGDGFRHGLPDRCMELGADRLLCTGHIHRGTAAHPAVRQPPTEQMAYASTNQGRSWSALSVIAHDRNLMLCEGSLCALPDGRILCIMRENSFVYEPMYLCESRDQGHTWSDPVPTPLIGHRPTLGLTRSGKLLCTYRDVGPDMGTCAWLGTEAELRSNFRVHGNARNNARLAKRGLRIRNGEEPNAPVRYALRPMTDPRSATARLEAEVRVDSSGKNGCGLRLGTWWKITTNRIVPDIPGARGFKLEPGTFNTIRLDYEAGTVTLRVNGRKRGVIHVEPDRAETRGILFGAPLPFQDNAVDCVWKRISLHVRDPRYLRDYQWQWTPDQGLPDQWRQDHVLELKNDSMANPGDFGYSGWTELEDGTFLCAYHHGGSAEPGYEPGRTAHILVTRFSEEDFA